MGGGERAWARLSGALLIAGGASFWLAWALMPMPGTADAGYILDAVGAARGRVWASCAVQLSSAAVWVAGLVLLPLPARAEERLSWRAGAALLAVGMTASAADAIYHLVAVELTAPGVSRELAAPVMARLQGRDLLLLLPGAGALALGLGVQALAAVRSALLPRAVLIGFVLAAVAVAVAAIARAADAGATGAAVSRTAALTAIACAIAPTVCLGWVLLVRRSAR